MVESDGLPAFRRGLVDPGSETVPDSRGQWNLDEPLSLQVLSSPVAAVGGRFRPRDRVAANPGAEQPFQA